MGGQDVFKGALGWDDWIWWAIIGGLGLLILLLLVCCCVCVQRAKRKGHQEALATVQRRQREADQRRVQQQQQQQQQQQFAMQQQQQQQQMGRFPPPQAVPTTPDQLQNGNGNYAYSKPVNAVPLAPQPQRKPMGPQVAANGYMLPPEHQQQQFGGQPPQHQPYNNQQQFPPYNQQQQFGGAQPQFAMAAAVPPPPPQHQQQYQKPYPPLPQQQQQYQQQQQQRLPPPPPQPEPEQPAPAPMKRRYRPPQRWYNATLENNSTPSAAAGSNPTAPAGSSPTSRSYHNAFVDDETAGNTLDSIRYDPYGADGNLNTAPFMSVTSPTKTGKKTPAQAKPPTTSLAKGVGINNTSQQKPPPVMTTKYQSAPALPPASPVGSFSGTRGTSDTNMAVMGTSLAQRIDALRDGSFEMAHSRISDNPGDLHSPADLSTSAFASYSASSPASSRQPLQPSDRRSAVLVGSVLSPNSSSSRSGTTVSSHPFSTFTQDDPTPVHHNTADDSFDASLFDSSERSARTQTASHRSVGSNYSNGQFDDADHPTTPRAKPALDTRSSVEF